MTNPTKFKASYRFSSFAAAVALNALLLGGVASLFDGRVHTAANTAEPSRDSAGIEAAATV